ncbi:glycosyltransferase family 4 protein [Sphingomonas gellani]|nr:glycosyltransferase family 1 protein [Sphingomonas gellani]
MLVASATGVATYARALRVAQQSLSNNALLLSGGRASAPDSSQSRLDRWRRSLRSVVPAGARAHAGADGFVRQDLFRLGQAFFTLHGRLMPVHVPGPAGIMHWSYPVPLRVTGWRNLYTVHDVIPLTHPELSPIDAVRHRRLLHQIAQCADRLVTVSRAAAGEIATTLDLSPERVVDCSQPVAVESIDALPPLPPGLEAGRYFLVCGTVEPRKNVGRIVAAYRRSKSTMPLVIAGPDGWHAQDVAVAIAQAPGVTRLHYQSRAAMLGLLARARALLMPSLAEGFGLPVAEAMALSTPVLTSAGGALAETAGKAALLVDPLDVAAIAAAIAELAHDDARCHTLAAAGRTRAHLFDAASFADRLAAVYGSLNGRG